MVTVSSSTCRRDGSGPVQNLLEDFDQIDYVRGQFRLGAFRVLELFHRRIADHGVFQLLFLQEHLSGVLEFFVLQQPLYQFFTRIFQFSATASGSRGRSILLLIWISSEAM